MLKHHQLGIVSGIIWFVFGFFLLQYGVRLLIEAIPQPIPFKMWTHPFLEILSPYLGNRENAALLMVAGCMITGKVKCHFVLSRSIKRALNRIRTLPNPASVIRIYSPGYYLLIVSMVCLGFFMRKSAVPADFRAACYMSIGCGMINGAILYFKASRSLMVGDFPDQSKCSVDLFDEHKPGQLMSESEG